MNPLLLDSLAREHQNDLLRDADHDRLAQLARTSVTPSHAVGPVGRGRRQLGLLLVALGTRLTCPPGQPC